MTSPPKPPGRRPDDPTSLLDETLQEALETLSTVDTTLLSRWILAGVSLFEDGRVPTLRETIDAGRRAVLAVAYERYGGNITHLAEAMGTSRRSAREQLKRYGLYDGLAIDDEPTPAEVDDDEDGETHPIRVEGEGEGKGEGERGDDDDA
ncbi:MAG: hypothetical protein KDK70_10905 [Myxococcales bacterium]|nr:hypothetical protein [Myxococcales bacterium]